MRRFPPGTSEGAQAHELPQSKAAGEMPVLEPRARDGAKAVKAGRSASPHNRARLLSSPLFSCTPAASHFPPLHCHLPVNAHFLSVSSNQQLCRLVVSCVNTTDGIPPTCFLSLCQLPSAFPLKCFSILPFPFVSGLAL